MAFLWLSVYRCSKCGKLVNADLENHMCGKLSGKIDLAKFYIRILMRKEGYTETEIANTLRG